MRIIFFGTAEFAVESLKKLHKAGYEIAAVVTATDKPAGRGLKPQFSPVKKAALELDLPILQPSSLKDNNFIQTLKNLSPDLQVVVAFRFLPRIVWEIPPKGTINLHSSYLPNYRGAAPINWVLINGEKYTGVTTFYINDKIDTGNIILRKKVEILPDDDAGTLHDRLMTIGADVLVETVKLIEQGKATPIPQEELMKDLDELKTAPKIFKDDCQINWNQNSQKIYNFIRGLSPYPGAWTNIRDKSRNKTFKYVKIYKASYELADSNLAPKTLVSNGKDQLKVATNDGYINILELQLPGKKRIKVTEFLKAYNPENLEIL